MAGVFQAGQRWVSETEPELGLGTVQEFSARTVTIAFPASGETRQYSLDQPPLRRVQFRVGDRIQPQQGSAIVVEQVEESNGLLVYHTGNGKVSESDLSDQTSFNKAHERLRNEQLDSLEAFDLRLAALQHQHSRRKSPIRGFVGGRIELIPHQLFIAPEVASRLTPRVLLADEVGLGKTIEACLIVHRLIQTRRAQRVLILVPEPLVHQWFVEVLRRFNLWFHIFDEDRCDAMETANPDLNPFLDDQLVLCGIDFLAQSEQRAQQALAADWDILVVDEAHHLRWAPDAASPEYSLVEALGRKTPGVLLLTATPEQLGIASHFARLRLLDPDRYYDLDEFLKEAESYREVAGIAEKLLHRQPIADPDALALARILRRDLPAVQSQVAQIEAGEESVREEMIGDLVDQHGTGRVMFRNTRAVVTGFPKRIACMHRLDPPAGATVLYERLAAEFAADTDVRSEPEAEPSLEGDPRVTWLADLLRELKTEKVLLICHSPSKVKVLDEALRRQLQLPIALFHEGMPLVQRDRNAAWFAEVDGAQLLLASEIGSEGRNFQFAHHLVLFDLPVNPELLEQRIGRLDRIGQESDVQVHVPYVAASPQEVLARWHHEGLDAIEKHLRGGQQLLERFGARVMDLAQDFHETWETAAADLESLIRDTRAAAADVSRTLEQGRDRLLELNSFRPEPAERIIQWIRAADQDDALENFMLAVFDEFGIQFDEIASRTYRLGSAGVFADAFPGLPQEGITVTLDRQRALAREDIPFLTWDHPLATGAMDLILGSTKGNSSFALWPDAETTGLYLETVYVLECVAPPALHIDRFLPPTPVRVMVDHRGHDAGDVAATDSLQSRLKPGNPFPLLHQPEFREELFPALLRHAETLASSKVPALIAQARSEMNTQLHHELARLKELQAVNRNVAPSEIEALEGQRAALDDQLGHARLRLDAVRLIQRGPVEGLSNR